MISLKKVSLKLRRNFWFQAAVLSGIAVACTIVLLVPKWIQVKSAAESVRNIERENQRIQELVLNSDHSGKTVEMIDNQRRLYQNMIPPRSNLSEVLERIASQAQSDRLEVVSMKPLRDELFKSPGVDVLQAGSKIYEVWITMNAVGKFRSFGRYLESLEQSPYKIIVKKMEIKTAEQFDPENPKEPELKGELTFSVLMKKNQK